MTEVTHWCVEDFAMGANLHLSSLPIFSYSLPSVTPTFSSPDSPSLLSLPLIKLGGLGRAVLVSAKPDR